MSTNAWCYLHNGRQGSAGTNCICGRGWSQPKTEQQDSTGDERLRQLASNRCIRQAWPEAGQEWTFDNDGLRRYAEAVIADYTRGVKEGGNGLS